MSSDKALADMWRAINALAKYVPVDVLAGVRSQISAVLATRAPRPITAAHLDALGVAMIATVEGGRIGAEHRLVLRDLYQLLRADAGASPSGT